LDLTSTKKISVIGNSGAGKSTLSKKLKKKLDIEVYTVDKAYWLPGWKLRSQQEFQQIHNHWLTKKSWIIDGVGYWRELEKRLTLSDLVIFLDVPVPLCIKRAEDRIISEKYSPNSDVTEGCVYGDMRNRQKEVIYHFNDLLWAKLISFLSSLSKTQVITISSYSELESENET
jgi:adenylate kinase family enzyme